jgi:hypothetical protein
MALFLAGQGLLVDPARATGTCSPIIDLVAQGRSNFAEIPVGPSFQAGPQGLPDAERCALTRSLSGANAYHCAWKFPYRDTSASTTFDALNQMMRGCFEQSPDTVTDSPVNHPDTYVQRRHVVDQVVVSVSVKDKVSLNETYVFIGVQGRIAD